MYDEDRPGVLRVRHMGDPFNRPTEKLYETTIGRHSDRRAASVLPRWIPWLGARDI